MIKKLLLALLIAIPFTSFAQGKFGIVDVQKVLEGVPAYTKMQTDLQEAAKKYEDEMKKLDTEYQTKVEEFQKLDPSTPDGIKQRRIEELQALEQRAAQYQQTAQQDLQRQQQTLMAPILQDFQAAVSAVGDEGSFTFIFEKGSSLYSGRMVEDVTQLVLNKMLKK